MSSTTELPPAAPAYEPLALEKIDEALRILRGASSNQQRKMASLICGDKIVITFAHWMNIFETTAHASPAPDQVHLLVEEIRELCQDTLAPTSPMRIVIIRINLPKNHENMQAIARDVFGEVRRIHSEHLPNCSMRSEDVVDGSQDVPFLDLRFWRTGSSYGEEGHIYESDDMDPPEEWNDPGHWASYENLEASDEEGGE